MKSRAALTLAGLLLCSSAFAAKPTMFNHVNDNFYISLDGLSYDYREDSNSGSLNDKENGDILGGAHIGFNMLDDDLYFNVDFQYFSGPIEYSGQHTINGGSAVAWTFNESRTFINASGKVGKQYVLDATRIFTPFIQVGYRSLERKIPGPATGQAVKDETYSHFYAGLGGKLDWHVHEHWMFSPHAMIATTFSPKVEQSMSGSSVDLDLGPKMLYDAGLQLSYAYSEDFDISFFTNYRFFKYGRSTDVAAPTLNTLRESGSQTTELTYGIGVLLHY